MRRGMPSSLVHTPTASATSAMRRSFHPFTPIRTYVRWNQVYVDIFGSPSTNGATILTMTDFSDPAGSQLRLSNAERDEAVSSLQAHAHDGRLSDAELASRISAARVAVTRGDLAPLFIDLPHPSSTGPFDRSAPNSAGFAPLSDGDYRQS